VYPVGTAVDLGKESAVAATVASSAARPAAHRYERDGLDFGRFVNLSDGVFAIALTLLVLTLDSLAVGPLITFALAFFLVANVWWQHHRIVAQLAWVEPGLIALNLALLACVALVPFPTSLVGADPRSRPAVLAFLAVFALLSLLTLAFILRAQRLGAWQRPVPRRVFRWIATDWTVNLSVHLGCLLVAVWAPLAALACLALGSTLAAAFIARVGPPERQQLL
jgi:uncharacterized membrane protein